MENRALHQQDDSQASDPNNPAHGDLREYFASPCFAAEVSKALAWAPSSESVIMPRYYAGKALPPLAAAPSAHSGAGVPPGLIAVRLRVLQAATGWSLKELADKLGCNEHSVKSWAFGTSPRWRSPVWKALEAIESELRASGVKLPILHVKDGHAPIFRGAVMTGRLEAVRSALKINDEELAGMLFVPPVTLQHLMTGHIPSWNHPVWARLEEIERCFGIRRG